MSDRQRALQLLQRIERESALRIARCSRRDRLRAHGGPGRAALAPAARLRHRHAGQAVDPEARSRRGRRPAHRALSAPLHGRRAVRGGLGDGGRSAPKRARGFVNAILRRRTRGAPEPDDLATRTAHPPWLIDRWTRTYGAERAAKIAEANQELSYPDVLALGADAPPESGARPARRRACGSCTARRPSWIARSSTRWTKAAPSSPRSPARAATTFSISPPRRAARRLHAAPRRARGQQRRFPRRLRAARATASRGSS